MAPRRRKPLMGPEPNSANAVYSHRLTGEPRIVEREQDEGGDRAAHVVFSTKAQHEKPNIYLCHIEGVPGLSHRLIQATLNAILRQAIAEQSASFHYPDPGGARRRSGEPKLHPFVPNIELIGHPSPSLLQDIEDGTLQEVVLIDQKPQAPLGGNPFLIEDEYRLRIKASRDMPPGNRVSAIFDAIRKKRSNFDKAKIRFVDPERIVRNIDFDIATGVPEQQKYLLSYIVRNIDPPMDESSLSIVPFLSDQMQERVISNRS